MQVFIILAKFDQVIPSIEILLNIMRISLCFRKENRTVRGPARTGSPRHGSSLSLADWKQL